MTEFVPSLQQQAVFDWIQTGRGSAFVEAVAGAGKTTTLINASRFMTGSVSSAMYNKKNATDFQNKLQDSGIASSQHKAGTFHAFGFSAWRNSHRKVVVDDKIKKDRIINTLMIPTQFQTFALNLCSLAKQAALGAVHDAGNERHWWDIVEHHDLDLELEDPETAKEGIRWAYKALVQSRKIAHEVIDYDDMIYMPIATNCRVWQNDWVLVDEAQDTNPARLALTRKMLRPGGRAIFVGDRHQAIYGFTGADNDAVANIIRDFGCTSLPLTITYRCPKSVVAEARTIVSHITAHETAPEGTVRTIEAGDIQKESLKPEDAILCRNTAPLVKMAFSFIKAGIACHVEGKSIGEGLLKLAGRWKTTSVTVLKDALINYREKQVAKLLMQGKESLAEGLSDRVDTLLVIAEGCPDVACVHKKIKDLFQDDTPTLTLSTVHKSKGREWHRVFLLGRNAYMPSKYARQAWQLEQEANLEYVAMTRAQKELIYAKVTLD
jgi:DNA helicase-2/ATP-dependent DNA helicase PcrA